VITIKEIEKVVTDLSPEQLAGFRAWYEEFDAASGTGSLRSM
jgi:hypothetical protein